MDLCLPMDLNADLQNSTMGRQVSAESEADDNC